MSSHSKNIFYRFVFQFVVYFILIYYGLQIWIGLSIQGGWYSWIIDEYFDFFHLLRTSLMNGSEWVASLFGYATMEEPGYKIRIIGGRGVVISYGCAGIAVMSFWMAFVLANRLSIKTKLIWLTFGLLLIWTINVFRIGLFLVALNKKWPMPFGIDHHTWFNILAYGAVLVMMYFLDKKTSRQS